MPEPKACTADEWESEGLDPQYFASWDHAGGCVYFNQGHPIMETQCAFFTGEWLDQNTRFRRRTQAEDIRDAIFAAYAEDTIGRILHYVATRGLADAKAELTDAALTIGAHGFENVQAKIEDSIRKSAGRGVVTIEGAA